jgi:CRISPR-associated endonuclease/helicase Cas3
MSAADTFPRFFEALWGHQPFAWQRSLALRVLGNSEGPWPEAISLPTAAGKTACLDIAVHALAFGRPGSSARRIFFVVDRRVIVDEAYDRARVIAQRLRTAENGILKDAADRLRELAAGDEPLLAFQLRGGMHRSDAWARSPSQPTIVASTVDQLGSRLLFRGYGRSPSAWPIQAGLAGNDSLILLDEAHCSQPFLDTLRAVRTYRGWADRPLALPFQAVILSATPPDSVDVFRDESDEPADPAHVLGRRQLAEKPASLVRIPGAAKTKANAALAHELATQATALLDGWNLRNDLGAPALVVFCNRVDTARLVHRVLAQRHGADCSLLTGRMRPLDKDDTVAEHLRGLSSTRSAERRLQTPAIVVSTQTLEVGADLDFDLLVSECASLDALRQRFGRLNRTGRDIPAQAAVVVREDQIEDADAVYGPALSSTWKWLESASENGVVDFGFRALQARLPVGAELAALNAPTRRASVMLPTHLDILAQTRPVPWPTPDLSVFLHGPDSGAADVQVCWRADICNGLESAIDTLGLCPPSSLECVSVPIGQVRRWLSGLEIAAGSDIESVEPDSEGRSVSERMPCAVRWRGLDEAELLTTPNQLRPGDVLVLPASVGGQDELGTIPTEAAADLGDRAHAYSRDEALLRLHPDLIASWPESPAGAALIRLLDRLGDDREEAETLVAELKEILRELGRTVFAPTWQWLARVAASLASDRKLERNLLPHPAGGLILRGSHRLGLHSSETDSFSDEVDAHASSGASVRLDDHLAGVTRMAATASRACCLDDRHVAVVEAAANLHDLGKADPRFQAWLHGGSPRLGGPLLAKSERLPVSHAASDRARRQAGYPEGGRHELLSSRLAEQWLSRSGYSVEDPELLLHLVESHHGHCRPFAPVVCERVPVSVRVSHHGTALECSSATGLERLDGGPAERYWRLTRRYGWWGLAWFEALLRLSDHRRSESEQREQEAQK